MPPFSSQLVLVAVSGYSFIRENCRPVGDGALLGKVEVTEMIV